MGKASRAKRERRAAPPVESGPRSTNAARTIWVITGGVAAVVAVVVLVLVLTRTKSPAPPPPATISATDTTASSALARAADAVGFYPPTEPGIGQIEGKPASASKPSTTATLLAAGSQAPRFTLKTPQGRKLSLASERGKAVLLEFFATWCPHCNAEAPHLEQLAKSLPAKRYAFVSVNADGEDAPSVFAYHRYYGLPFPALLDPSDMPGTFTQRGSAGPVSTAYGVAGFPTFYVIDPKGRVTWAGDGEQPDAKLHAELVRAAVQ